jgi:hypothetical protein
MRRALEGAAMATWNELAELAQTLFCIGVNS